MYVNIKQNILYNKSGEHRGKKRRMLIAHEEFEEDNIEEPMDMPIYAPPVKKAKILQHRKRKSTNLFDRTQFVENLYLYFGYILFINFHKYIIRILDLKQNCIYNSNIILIPILDWLKINLDRYRIIVDLMNPEYVDGLVKNENRNLFKMLWVASEEQKLNLMSLKWRI